jgi:Domain of unknown function (DUF927)
VSTGVQWTDFRRGAALSEAIEFAAGLPPERDDELARHFWPEILAEVGGELGAVMGRVRAARAEAGERKGPATDSPYRVALGRICLVKRNGHGQAVLEPLCNFDARIKEEVVFDDGSGETKVALVVQGALADGTPLPEATVSAGDFGGMGWVIDRWGSRAIVSAGHGRKDHLRAAIQHLSADAERRTVYRHTGWREIGGRWLYLHGDGAIGPDGLDTSVSVDLHGSLARIRLPDPPVGEELAKAVRASLGILQLGKRLAYPVLATAYRAVLGSTDWSLFLVGSTGLGKSELAALAQQHFGAEFHRRNLPANWISTGNALESMAFTAMHCLLVADFKPGGSKSEIDKAHALAERFFRAQGNSSGRSRCNQDGTVRGDRPPRGSCIATGEDLPRGESLRARLFAVEVREGDIDRPSLTPYQREAAAGVYAVAMAGFLRWLAPQYEQLRAGLPAEHAEFRAKALTGGHSRTPGIVADLALGMRYWLRYAVAVGAISREERDRLAAEAWASFMETGVEQQREIASQEPVVRFVELLSSAISSGRAHVANEHGEEPVDPVPWGWREEQFGAGDRLSVRWKPQGHRVGWLVGDDLFLDPDAVYAEVQRLAGEQGEPLPVSKQTLQKRLKERKLLRSTSARDRCTSKQTVEGRRRSVLHLAARTIRPDGSAGASVPVSGDAVPVGKREPGQENAQISREKHGIVSVVPVVPVSGTGVGNKLADGDCCDDVIPADSPEGAYLQKPGQPGQPGQTAKNAGKNRGFHCPGFENGETKTGTTGTAPGGDERVWF